MRSRCIKGRTEDNCEATGRTQSNFLCSSSKSCKHSFVTLSVSKVKTLLPSCCTDLHTLTRRHLKFVICQSFPKGFVRIDRLPICQMRKGINIKWRLGTSLIMHMVLVLTSFVRQRYHRYNVATPGNLGLFSVNGSSTSTLLRVHKH